MVHKMKKVYKIYSRGITPEGKLVYRTEFVDADKNILFKPAKGPNDIKEIYEGFWNVNPKEDRVVVDKVERVKTKSKGENWGIKLLK